jgi:hypothetical protein
MRVADQGDFRENARDMARFHSDLVIYGNHQGLLWHGGVPPQDG